MKRFSVANILSVGLISTFFMFSCKKDECSNPVPSMSYDSFSLVNDSAYLLVHNFIDCDGDIGLSEGDTLPPFDVDGNYYFNLKVDVFIRQNNQWVKYDFQGGIGLNARIVPLADDDQEDVVEGKIKHYINPVDLLGLGDSLRFSTTLIDRAFNESEPATSSTVIIRNN